MIVVVGGGHQGLVAAIHLAAAGQQVLVLEAAPEPGGAVTSGQDTLPGFVHDRCSAFFPLAAASPAFAELGLERRGLAWVNPDVPMVHLLPAGRAVALHRDLAATAASLEECSPGAGAAWERLVGRLWPQRENLMRAALSPFPPLRPASALALGLRVDAVRLARQLLGPVARLGRELFGDDDAAAWLAGSAAHSDLSPRAPGSGALGLVLNLLGHVVGWPYPRGGAGRLTEALVARLCELGGEVRCRSPVTRVELGPGGVQGLTLAEGERLGADAVIATVGPARLLWMLPPDALPARLRRRLAGWRYGLGTLKVDYALAAPVPWDSPTARRAGVVHVGGSLAEVTAAQEQARAERMPARPMLVVGQHTLGDPSRAPSGRHTLYAYARVPSRPGLGEAQLVERVDARIEEFAPGFRDVVLARAVRTPERIERDNPSLVGGDLAAGSLDLDQQLVLRPTLRLARHRTPIPGLYVAGAATYPGPGVHGVSGRAAADAVLTDLRRARVRRAARSVRRSR
jgi:phytoene dehydrogenase-like protein